jgi:hypothetical protein
MRHRAWIAVLLVACGGGRISSGGSSEASEGSSATDAGTSSSGPGADLPGEDTGLSCADGLIDCGGECTNVDQNNDHCGECDRECRVDPPTEAGYCWSGKCSPIWYDCFGQDAGFDDCGTYCASIGQACIHGLGCSPGPLLWGADHEAECLALDHYSALGQSTMACSDQLLWGITAPTGDKIAFARCCCTQ